MGVSKGQIDYILGQLERFGAVSVKKMFGGAGLYADGLFFALITSQDEFFLKVDDSNRPDFEARNCRYFEPYGDGRRMNYMTVPEDVVEDPDDLAAWARKAVAVAARAKK